MAKKTIFLIGILLVTGLGGFYYYYTYMRQQLFRSAHTTAEELHMRPGGRDEAIQKFREAVSYAPNNEEAAHLKLMLAFDLFNRNLGDDRVEAIHIFKEVANDLKVSDRRRNAVTLELAFSLWRAGSETVDELARQYVFNEEPYAAHLRNADGNVYWAISRMFEKSDETYPTAQAKVMTAFMHVQRLLSDRMAPWFSSKSEAAEFGQQLLRDAEALYNSPNFSYPNGRLALLYLKSAQATDWSNVFLKNLSDAEIDAAYERAIRVAMQSPDDVHSQIVLLESRYYYALSLMSRSGDQKSSQIRELLRFVVSAVGPQYSSFQTYLRNVAARPDDTHVKSQVLKLVPISPEFKTYLEEIGWKF